MGPQRTVVIADARTAVGSRGAQFLHRHFHPLPGSACAACTKGGAAVVGVKCQGTRDAVLGQHGLPDQDGRQVCTFALMNFPAHNLPTEYIDDQIEIEKHTCHWPGHPRDAPSPDIAGRTYFVAGRWLAPNRRLSPATVMLLTIRTQNALKAGLGCKIPHLIGQIWDNLAGRKAGKFLRITGFQHSCAFCRAKLISGFLTRHEGAQIRLHMSVFLPTP